MQPFHILLGAQGYPIIITLKDSNMIVIGKLFKHDGFGNIHLKEVTIMSKIYSHRYSTSKYFIRGTAVETIRLSQHSVKSVRENNRYHMIRARNASE
ncbi:hypothetical protein ADUPG1_005038 [Aduncisulcus paluster]|uniref:Sm domain-containing protein n=1 Tax=Aduncisulcus paluster TaxID=2918883 RepID=A0ABQ5K870_9EUKA|nr:hypothetical protein ADUPG1_005038 [Aduncisulcus paluster]